MFYWESVFFSSFTYLSFAHSVLFITSTFQPGVQHFFSFAAVFFFLPDSFFTIILSCLLIEANFSLQNKAFRYAKHLFLYFKHTFQLDGNKFIFLKGHISLTFIKHTNLVREITLFCCIKYTFPFMKRHFSF